MVPVPVPVLAPYLGHKKEKKYKFGKFFLPFYIKAVLQGKSL
jgi:hypothetical protein